MSVETTTTTGASAPPPLDVTSSRNFASWLDEAKVGLAFTAPGAGKVYFAGLNEAGGLALFERGFDKALACAIGADQTLYLGTRYQIWRFDNVLAAAQETEGYDRLYVPQTAFTTGDLDIHEIALGADGRVFFVNTLFNCLATADERHSFLPVWRPPFITALAAGDRCHLTGVAMADGAPRYVTAASQSDKLDGWRGEVGDGGCVIDVASGEIVLAGLSMPHAPRLYRDRLWLLESGSGYFGHVDLDKGEFHRIALCPGYLRGLDFVGKYAVVGLSKKRGGDPFVGLELERNLGAKGASPQCAIAVVDLEKGALAHWMRISGAIEEIGGVAVLPGARRPAAIGILSDEISRVISIGPDFGDGVADSTPPANPKARAKRK